MSQILRKQGYKPVWFWVGLAIVGELGGGLSFALGFLTPLGAAGIFGAVVMAVVLQSDDLTGVVKGHAVAAQGVAEQIIERRSTDAHGNTRAVRTVVPGRGRRASGEHRFRVAIEGEGVRRAAGRGRSIGVQRLLFREASRAF